ncbi:MAG: IS1182 family transposase [Candidatus Omnitrophica bacterium]|nr:IS1182 family transposase [Candidatus Omnitrophota bacterium]
MAYRYGTRDQLSLFPPCVDDYVPRNAVVRAYDTMVEALDFEELGIEINPDNVGNPQYDPKAMLKLYVYGIAYGIRSSRKLEREVNYNVSFMWLMKQLKPDHKTIAEFRRKNKKALANVLKQCARMCLKLELVEGNTLFADGSKIRANASIKNDWTRERCEEALKKADESIDRILKECEDTDFREEDQPTLIKMQSELADNEVLKSKVLGILNDLKIEKKERINIVDPECAVMHSQKGSHSGYNAQVVVDEKHGLIISADVTNENNDYKQFAEQINLANETLQGKCSTACADSGYANTPELEKISEQGIKVIVPSIMQAAEKSDPFAKKNFTYDRERDCYVCPTGHTLSYRGTHGSDTRIYKTANNACKHCHSFNDCTKIKTGRVIQRLKNEELKEKFEALYRAPDSQRIYKLRKEKVELTFGHIKRNLKFDGFLLRGKAGARAEISLAATCFNMARMITIVGVDGIIRKLQM